MSTGAILLQILATGGVAAGATGLVLQRVKTRDDLRQWQRDQRLTAAINLAEMADEAEARLQGDVVIESTGEGSMTVLLRPEDLEAAVAAASAVDGRNLRIKLLYGLASPTALAGAEWFDSIMNLHTTLTRLRRAEGETLDLGALDPDGKAAFEEASDRLIEAKERFLNVAWPAINEPLRLERHVGGIRGS